MIKELLNEHLAAGFPDGYRGEEIKGIDLALLDADTFGCVEGFLTERRRGGNLDIWRTAVLGLCYRDLSIVVLELSDYAKGYFQRLETIARLTLEAVIDGARGS